MPIPSAEMLNIPHRNSTYDQNFEKDGYGHSGYNLTTSGTFNEYTLGPGY